MDKVNYLRIFVGIDFIFDGNFPQLFGTILQHS
jgi:hypothetical protein